MPGVKVDHSMWWLSGRVVGASSPGFAMATGRITKRTLDDTAIFRQDVVLPRKQEPRAAGDTFSDPGLLLSQEHEVPEGL